MTIKINQHCFKIILQNDSFENHPNMEETLKNVVLPLIIEMLSKKKHTQFG